MMGQSLNEQLIFRSQWALCMIPSHGTKSTMLDGKRMQHSPKQSYFHQPERDFSLFWMSQCVACPPARQILMGPCKGSIEGLVCNGTVLPCQ